MRPPDDSPVRVVFADGRRDGEPTGQLDVQLDFGHVLQILYEAALDIGVEYRLIVKGILGLLHVRPPSLDLGTEQIYLVPFVQLLILDAFDQLVSQASLDSPHRFDGEFLGILDHFLLRALG